MESVNIAFDDTRTNYSIIHRPNTMKSGDAIEQRELTQISIK